jgi:hypothetical protein
LVALLGVATAAPALAVSEVKLEVNDNCVEPNWPCWATPGSNQPAAKVALASGGSVAFMDHAKEANLAWTGSAPTCELSVPVSPTVAKTGWEGKCTFATSGIYNFESTTMFKELGLDYTKYEIVVGGTPKAKTMAPSLDSQTEVTLNGSVSPEGSAVEYHFEYEGPGVTGKKSTANTPLGATDFVSHSVSQTVSGLQPGSTYKIELVVNYGASEALGGPETFTTPVATAPMVTTTAASGLHETAATLNGKVDPEGGEETKYWFEWGIGSGASYENRTPEVSLSSDGAQHVASLGLTELSAGTEYHYRLVAQNKIGGPTMGSDVKFETESPPPAKKTEPPSEPSPPAGTPPPTTPILLSTLPKPEEKLAILPVPLVPGSLKLTTPRHSANVHGTIAVAQSGAGGRLEVDLTTKSAFVSKARNAGSKRVRVGRFVRQNVPAGKLSFAVALTAQGKRALTRRHSLPLTVTLTLTRGASSTIVRSVTLRS